MSFELSEFVDLAHLSKRTSAAALAQPDATLTGVITSVVDASEGLVEIRPDGSSGPPVVVRLDPGITHVGARVLLPRDSTGRVTGVKPPVGTIPEDAEVIAVGEEAQRVLAQGEQLKTLDRTLVEARSELSASNQNLLNRIEGFSREVSDLSMDLYARTNILLHNVNAAQADATAAQKLAAKKSAIYRASTPPVSGDYSPGDVWWQCVGDRIDRQWVYQAASGWSETEFSGEIISAGTVRARQVDTLDLAAGIGRFLRITTDQLTAGDAKIAGSLLAEDIAGKRISGSTITSGAEASYVRLADGTFQVVNDSVETARIAPENGVSVRNPLTERLTSISDLLFGSVYGISAPGVYYSVANRRDWYGPWSETPIVQFTALTTRVVLLSQIGRVRRRAGYSNVPMGARYGGITICPIGTSNWMYSHTYKSGNDLAGTQNAQQAVEVPSVVNEFDISIFENLTVGVKYQVSMWNRYGNDAFGNAVAYVAENMPIDMAPCASLVMPI